MTTDELARGNAVRLMNEKGLSQAEVVRRAVALGHHIDTATLNRALRGKGRMASQIEPVAAALDVPMCHLLREVAECGHCAPPAQGIETPSAGGPGEVSGTIPPAHGACTDPHR